MLHRLGEEIIAGDDCDRNIDQVGFRSDKSQKLQPVGDGHPHVEDDRVRTDVVGQFESGFGGQCRLDTEPFELQHPRERVGHRSIVVYDKDRARRLVDSADGRGNHRIILKGKDMARQGRAAFATVSLYNVA